MKVPHTYAITAVLILLAAALTWVIPAGEYTRTVAESDGVARTVLVDGSFHAVAGQPQSWQVFGVLLDGFVKQAGIIAFLLIIGGAFQVLAATRAVDVGIRAFLSGCARAERGRLMRRLGVDNVVIAAVIVLFSLFGAVFGMSEETLAFIGIIIPLAVSMGFDSLTGLCMVYVAAHVGFSGAVLNPFTIGLAQGLSELPLFSGYAYRMVCWAVLTTVLIIAVLIYAHRVKRDPTRSPMYAADAYWRGLTGQNGATVSADATQHLRSACVVFALTLSALIAFAIVCPESTFAVGSSSVTLPALPVAAAAYGLMGVVTLRRGVPFFILTMLGMTIVLLIVGVMAHGWYLTEISAIFLAMGILSGFAAGLGTDGVIAEFTAGAKDILGAAIVVGLATGIILILEQGRIIDPILHAMAGTLGEGGRVVSVEVMYWIQTLINIIIPSGSAKAALTMPIMAPFSDVIGLSRQATVMAYQFGDGFTNMITPTSGVLMGALALARVPYGVWFRWFVRLLAVFIVLGMLLLLPTVLLPLEGF